MKTISVDTIYDARGNVSQKSLPYFVDGTAQFTQYWYDCLGRQITQTNPTAKQYSTAYFKGLTTYTDPVSNVKKEQRDAYGRITAVTQYESPGAADPGFVTKYAYDVLGNLVNVIDAEGNTTTIGYDSLSRRRTMADPDTGHWTYGYDANGNLTSQIDARDVLVQFDYDAVNRITHKRYGGASHADYYYDGDEPIGTCEHALSSSSNGRLTAVIDDSGTTCFDYDAYGRVSAQTKRIDTNSFTFRNTYDALGRIESIQYPGPVDETVNYHYEDTGVNLISVDGYAGFTNYNASVKSAKSISEMGHKPL